MNTNDAKRQLNEEHALDEMDISENGPNLPNADKILLSAMNKYCQFKCHQTVPSIYVTKGMILEHTAQAKLYKSC